MAFSKKALEHLDFSFEKTRFHQNLFLHFVSEHLTIREIPITEHPGIAPKIGWDYSSTIIAALPAYNEEKYIAKIISRVKLFVDTVLIVDDGSMDETQMIARQMGAYVIRHEKNLGYGAALQTIFAAARDLNADVLVTMDADGQHDPQDITRVLEPLLFGADVVIGSRFIGKTKNNIPSYRKVGMKVLDHATNIAGVKKVTDTQSGFRAYNKKAIDVVAINSAGMSVGSEILIQISDYPLKIAEVPITAIYDTKDTSTHNPLSHGISVLGRIIALISYRRPLPAFGIPGLILFIIGVAGSILAFFNYQITEHFPIPLSLLSAIILFLGLILGITGLILNALIVITGEHRK
jgi:glycosyltransferase involved in cell wall biosynthesis